MKLVFHLEDAKGNLISVKQQIEIDINEEELKRADEISRPAQELAIATIGDCYASNAGYGRGLFLREKFEAVGIILSKWLDRTLSPSFGCKHIALLNSSDNQISQ